MDYEQKYKEALERAKVINPGTADYNIVTYIFPELTKNNEDEEIRKGVIKYLEQSQFGEEHYQIDDDIVRSYIDWLEKQGEQKPIDKIERKFKVGDWIVNSERKLRHILGVDNTGYQTANGWLSHEFYENTYHLWTIQDAKDGDILQLGLITVIFKEFANFQTSTHYCHCYCSYCSDEFKVSAKQDFYGCIDAKPATKEQRYLFFQKMKEAGYEWDAENKELKKIEQKSAWSKKDEKMINAIIYDLERHGGKEDSSYSAEINWLKFLKERIKGE